MRQRRQDPVVVDEERSYNASRRRASRSVAHERIAEDRERVSEYRRDANYQLNETARNLARNAESRPNRSPLEQDEQLAIQRQRRADRTFNNYFEAIKMGPTDVCVCCGGLWFDLKSHLKMSDISNLFSDLPVAAVFYLARHPCFTNSVEDSHIFCVTCYNFAIKGKVPSICLANGLDFPPIPNELQNLTVLEERSPYSVYENY